MSRLIMYELFSNTFQSNTFAYSMLDKLDHKNYQRVLTDLKSNYK